VPHQSYPKLRLKKLYFPALLLLYCVDSYKSTGLYIIFEIFDLTSFLTASKESYTIRHDAKWPMR
jgi:hypothetical protein